MALDSKEAQFVESVSAQTGIDPRVLVAWITEEGANAPGGTGGYNYLNLKPYPGDIYSSVSPGGFEQFSSVLTAVEATVRRLQQPFASPILKAAQARATPQQEIAAIASTGWDQSNYGGFGSGPNLQNEFGQLFGGQAGLTSSYQGPGTAVQVAETAGTGSATIPGITGSYSLQSLAGDTSKAASSVYNSTVGALSGIWGWILSHLERLGLLLAGALLVILGVVLVARDAGVSVPVPATGA